MVNVMPKAQINAAKAQESQEVYAELAETRQLMSIPVDCPGGASLSARLQEYLKTNSSSSDRSLPLGALPCQIISSALERRGLNSSCIGLLHLLQTTDIVEIPA